MAELKCQPEWWMPRAWPLFWRRTFLLTLPVSGPLWVAAVFAGALGIGLFVLVIGIPAMGFFMLKEELWDDNPSTHSSRDRG